MARNTKIQLRRGTQSQWNLSGATLAEGEIGYEIDTGRFKIGKIGGSLWSALPYAGGSDIVPGSGMGLVYSSSSNSYTLHNISLSSGNGISVQPFILGGDGTSTPSGTGYYFGLANRLQTLSNLTSSGIIVGINSSGVTTRSLSDGNNIAISNRDGIDNNPIINLSSSLTGLNSISGVNEFRIGSSSGIVLDAGDGSVTIDDLNVTGETNLNGNINIGLAAQILATGPIAFSGTPVIFVGPTIFDTLPKVGPTGDNGVNATGVSLVGHSHEYADITDFCDGVASCVDTALLASTGIQLNYSNDTLNIALSGQALKLHNLNSDGLIVRDNGDIVSRTIVASGNNILVGSGNGVGGNPNVGLNPDVSITSLSTTQGVTVGSNLVVQGDFTVNGNTVTTNVSTIVVEDPSIKLGQPSGALETVDLMDRGIEFVYQTGDAVPITGFFGYDQSANAWTFLNPATNSNGIYTGTTGLINVGGLYSTGEISGTILTSTIAGPNAPIVVASTGLVSSLNADLLDGQHGSYYRNWSNITGLASPTYSVTLTGDVSGTVTSSATTLGNNISLSVETTILNNTVELGTDTTGAYARTLNVSGTGLTVTASGTDDGTDYVVTSNATPSNVTGTIVARNGSGDFSASNITITGLITESVSGSLPEGIYKSSSISGINSSTYLHNFIIDGGTP